MVELSACAPKMKRKSTDFRQCFFSGGNTAQACGFFYLETVTRFQIEKATDLRRWLGRDNRT
jgi:hypothetical protein